MKKAKELITFFKKLSRPIKILFCSGLFFLVLGSILVLLSFQNEVLDNRYIITDIKEHISKPLTDLSPGEIRATVSTEYQKQGIYKLVFTNYTNAKDTKNIIQKDSYFSIIDIIGNTTTEKGLGYYVLKFDEAENTITIFSLSYLLTVYKESLDNIERCIEYVDMMNPIKD